MSVFVSTAPHAECTANDVDEESKCKMDPISYDCLDEEAVGVKSAKATNLYCYNKSSLAGFNMGTDPMYALGRSWTTEERRLFTKTDFTEWTKWSHVEVQDYVKNLLEKVNDDRSDSMYEALRSAQDFKGADSKDREYFLACIMQCACQMNKAHIVKSLLDLGLDPDVCPLFDRLSDIYHRDSPLKEFIYELTVQIQKMYDFLPLFRITNTPLLTATSSEEETLPVMKLLLEGGADVQARDQWRSTALGRACALPDKEQSARKAELLLQKGAQIRNCLYTESAVISAVKRRNLPFLKTVLGHVHDWGLLKEEDIYKRNALECTNIIRDDVGLRKAFQKVLKEKETQLKESELGRVRSNPRKKHGFF